MTNEEIVKREFKKAYSKKYKSLSMDIIVYAAPAAVTWVVIAGEEAWVASGAEEEFVFWGPAKKTDISFPIPPDFKVE